MDAALHRLVFDDVSMYMCVYVHVHASRRDGVVPVHMFVAGLNVAMAT